MADRLPVYGAQEKVDVPRAFSSDLPRVTDIGDSISGIGTAALRAVEPELRHKAEEQAIGDAGKASIVRSPDGGYVRANTTKGGGLIYAETYANALDKRQLAMMSEDYATQLTKVASEWIDDPTKRDPRAFLSFASGLGQAMVERAPDSMRAELDTTITRTMGDSVRGFSQAAHQHNRRELSDGLKLDLDNYTKAIAALARSGGDPADIRSSIAALVEKQKGVIQSLHGLGEIGDTAPYLRSIEVGNYDERQFVEGADAMQGLGANLDKMDDTQLQRLSYFATGTTDGGKVGTMDLATFRKVFPSAYWQHQAGEVASRVLSDRIAQRNQAATIAALTKPETAGQVEADIKAQNYNPASGLSYEQTIAANREYAGHGPVAQQLRDPDRRLQTLGYIAQVGAAPIGTNDALRALVLSSDPKDNASAFDFIWNARDVTTGSAWTGLNWFNTLPDDVKALAEFDATMRRAGVNATTRIREILDNRTGRNRSYNDIVGLFGRESDYAQAATGAIATAFNGVKPADLGPAAPLLLKDFNRLMTINADLYPTKEQALAASAKMLGNAWTPSSVFVDGIGDKRLVGEGMPTWWLDRVLADTPTLRSGNPAGASFSNGRVKIRATGDAPATGYPYYEFLYFNDHGERLGRGALFPMQRIVDTWHAYVSKTAAQGAARRARRDASADLGARPRSEERRQAALHRQFGGRERMAEAPGGEARQLQ
jgi:hypothetical protein